jgi:hypothetical protein
MRSCRLSGSVEGVVSNHDPYSDWDGAKLLSFESRPERSRAAHLAR